MKKDLCQILQTQTGLSPEDYQEAKRIRAEKGGAVSDILIKKKLLTESQYLEALSVFYDIPFMPKLPLEHIDGNISQYVPIHFLKKYMLAPLADTNPHPASPETEDEKSPHEAAGLRSDNRRSYLIAVNDPGQFHPIDDLIRILNPSSFQVVLSTKDAILSAINIAYDMSRDSAEQLVQNMEDSSDATIISDDDTADLLDDTSDAPIIKLVNHIISQASKARASDIHVEPYQNSFKVRYRVDGILYDLLAPPKWIQAALISRIKVMAKMNIAEKRLPQDGRIEVKIGDQDIDVRVSTLPTAFGERVVLRLLNKSASFLTLTDLGIVPKQLQIIKDLITSPNGIILVTGPTGSGKTTTLYAVLSTINTPDINIITIEDPIEYQIPGISQIQVNHKIDLTFARGLRSIVRQDPDVILVGEIRDHETAEIAVQSALTGHLVFSTLHTNDSASAITRLVDIGVEPFLIASSVIAVAAQRLVRVLCKECKEAYTPDELALKSIGASPEQIKGAVIYRAKGCPKCFHTGYKGRMAILEMMIMSEGLKSLILKTYDSNQIKAEALKSASMTTLRQDGILKVLSGLTTVEEVIRVTQR
ncbi:MAG: type II secretion system protein GspE [Desulfobacteraceae bacterium IS3]|nr:MAG: type II secretion system protein GspE [Desulfobacteraceae bacterium IS3]